MERFRKRLQSLFVYPALFLAGMMLQGCASSNGSNGTNPAAAITVSVTPPVVNLESGKTLNLDATVINDTNNRGVTWALSGAGCSGATCGTLTGATASAVTYTAPAAVPSPATVTLTATSVADGTKTGAAVITVTAAPVIGVAIAPMNPSVQGGIGSQNFTATLTNDAQSKGVSWSISGTGCSGATCGALSG